MPYYRKEHNPDAPIAGPRAQFTDADAAAASQDIPVTVIPAQKKKRDPLHWHDALIVKAEK